MCNGLVSFITKMRLSKQSLETSKFRDTLKIIFADNDYCMMLLLSGQDTLESRRTKLTERFFRRSVLCKASCLHYLLPNERDSSVTDRLRHAKIFEHISARTNKFRNSFIPYCLRYYD